MLYCDKSDSTTQKQGGYYDVLYCDKSDFTTQKQGCYHGVLYCDKSLQHRNREVIMMCYIVISQTL